MFDNLLYQNAGGQLISDIKNNCLPSSILLSGPQSSGKLTCALELARILSCTQSGPNHGDWQCTCPACLRNKSLVNTNVLLAGPRDLSLEILAASRALLYAGANNTRHLDACRYLFIRAVRKLTMRFSQVLWEGDNKLSKLAPLVESIEEQLELLDPKKQVPSNEELEKIIDSIQKNADKLESTFMYDSLPIDQIRRASFWAHLKSNDGKKVLIIENADRMNESCRNALLKILEEPPSDVVFILTTTRRGAVMPTILSRVRTYNFTQRTQVQEREVLDRVFHADSDKLEVGITNYLNNFLPVKADAILQAAGKYYDGIKNGHLIQIDELVKECSGFEPRILFKLFLQSLMQVFRVQNPSPAQIEYEEKNVECIRECYNNVTIYNQTPLSALENLYRDLAYNKKICLG